MTTRSAVAFAVPEAAVGSRTAPRPASVWLLTNAPSPYQAELFTAVAERPDMKLAVRLMRASSASGSAVCSDYGGVVMAGVAPANWRDEFRLHPRALREAAFGRYDCYVLSGLYTSITFLCCAGILALRGKPWIVWLERPRRFAVPGSSQGLAPLARLRDRVRRRIVRSATRVLCIGSAARDEYADMVGDDPRLDVLPYCCDISRYDDVTLDQTSRFRQAHGLADSVVFLYSGQLIPRKGVDTLLSAFAQVAGDTPTASLVILGDGPLRSELESQVAPEHRSRVHFLGHLPQQELPIAFRAADVFAFPSRHDGWGVVINEACAARLPIIASRETGAVHDLVEVGRSGFLHPAEDAGGFATSMRRLLDDCELRRRMGVRSRELVECLSPERGAKRFADSIAKAIA